MSGKEVKIKLPGRAKGVIATWFIFIAILWTAVIMVTARTGFFNVPYTIGAVAITMGYGAIVIWYTFRSIRDARQKVASTDSGIEKEKKDGQ